jgi:hypothetical protein
MQRSACWRLRARTYQRLSWVTHPQRRNINFRNRKAACTLIKGPWNYNEVELCVNTFLEDGRKRKGLPSATPLVKTIWPDRTAKASQLSPSCMLTDSNVSGLDEAKVWKPKKPTIELLLARSITKPAVGGHVARFIMRLGQRQCCQHKVSHISQGM